MFDRVSKSVTLVLPTPIVDVLLFHSALDVISDTMHKKQMWWCSCNLFAISETVQYVLFFQRRRKVEIE